VLGIVAHQLDLLFAKNKVEAESLIENGAYNNVVDENIETKSSRHIEEIK